MDKKKKKQHAPFQEDVLLDAFMEFKILQESNMTEKSLLEELELLLRVYYVGDISVKGNHIFLRTMNNRTFAFSVKEIKYAIMP